MYYNVVINACLFKNMGMVEQLITYIVYAIIYIMHLLYANLYFIHIVYILFNFIVMNYVLYIVLIWT